MQLLRCRFYFGQLSLCCNKIRHCTDICEQHALRRAHEMNCAVRLTASYCVHSGGRPTHTLFGLNSKAHSQVPFQCICQAIAISIVVMLLQTLSVHLIRWLAVFLLMYNLNIRNDWEKRDFEEKNTTYFYHCYSCI